MAEQASNRSGERARQLPRVVQQADISKRRHQGVLRSCIKELMIQFNKETCRDLDAALRREWLETNGIGGFASSTIIGLNTRRYHGLLTAATKPPVGRLVLL